MKTVRLLLILVVPVLGCRKDPSDPKAVTAQTNANSHVENAAETLGGDGPGRFIPKALTSPNDWCREHGVPESVCARCKPALIAGFKDRGDWCGGHDVPESQCIQCNPELAAKWAALKPAGIDAKEVNKAEKSGGTASVGPERFVPVALTSPTDWCREHGVPKSVCARCNVSLSAGFKERGDWCGEHGLPESQCFDCNPQVAAKWAALKPRDIAAAEAAGAEGESGIRVEPLRGSVTKPNDPLCSIEKATVRFADASIAKKAGIETETVRPRRLSATLECPGELEFDQTRLVRITARVPGVTEQAVVALGARVEAGDVLMIIESPDLGEAKSAYIGLREAYELARADHQRISAIAAGVRRMLEILTADAAAKEAAEKLAEVRAGEAKSRLLTALSRLEVARAQQARDADLGVKGITTGRDVQASQRELLEAESGFATLREEIAMTSERELLAVEKALRTATASMGAARRRLHILGLSDEHVASLGTADEASISRFELRSPQAGTVVELHAVKGESVEAAETLVTVADTTSMWLTMDCYERDLVGLRTGQPVIFMVDGLPGRGGEGRVSWISQQIDDRTRTVKVRAELPNEDGRLRGRMFGLGRIILREDAEVLSVPREAVQSDGCCQLVFVRQEETLYLPRKVDLGVAAGDYVEVRHGLSLGEAVVSRGSFLLKTEILKSSIGAGCCEVEPGR